jgi:hypothetical protein
MPDQGRLYSKDELIRLGLLEPDPVATPDAKPQESGGVMKFIKDLYNGVVHTDSDGNKVDPAASTAASEPAAAKSGSAIAAREPYHDHPILRMIGATGARLGSGFLASEGGALGAAVGAGGEAIAQGIESPAPLNNWAIGTEGALNAVPFSKVARSGKTALSGAARLAGLMEAGNLVRRMSHGGSVLPSSKMEWLMELGSMGLGGAIGAHTKLAGEVPKVAPAVEKPISPVNQLANNIENSVKTAAAEPKPRLTGADGVMPPVVGVRAAKPPIDNKVVPTGKPNNVVNAVQEALPADVESKLAALDAKPVNVDKSLIASGDKRALQQANYEGAQKDAQRQAIWSRYRNRTEQEVGKAKKTFEKNSAQEARNLNAREKFVQKDNMQAGTNEELRDAAARKLAAQQEEATRINNARNRIANARTASDMKEGPTTISDSSVKVDTTDGSSTMRTTYSNAGALEAQAEADAEAAARRELQKKIDETAAKTEIPPAKDPVDVGRTLYRSKQEATNAVMASGKRGAVAPVKRGKWIAVYEGEDGASKVANVKNPPKIEAPEGVFPEDAPTTPAAAPEAAAPPPAQPAPKSKGGLKVANKKTGELPPDAPKVTTDDIRAELKNWTPDELTSAAGRTKDPVMAKLIQDELGIRKPPAPPEPPPAAPTGKPKGKGGPKGAPPAAVPVGKGAKGAKAVAAPLEQAASDKPVVPTAAVPGEAGRVPAAGKVVKVVAADGEPTKAVTTPVEPNTTTNSTYLTAGLAKDGSVTLIAHPSEADAMTHYNGMKNSGGLYKRIGSAKIKAGTNVNTLITKAVKQFGTTPERVNFIDRGVAAKAESAVAPKIEAAVAPKIEEAVAPAVAPKAEAPQFKSPGGGTQADLDRIPLKGEGPVEYARRTGVSVPMAEQMLAERQAAKAPIINTEAVAPNVVKNKVPVEAAPVETSKVAEATDPSGVGNVDISGLKSGEKIAGRVAQYVRGLLPRVAPENNRKIEWVPSKAYKGMEGHLYVNGEPVADVDRYGRVQLGYGVEREQFGIPHPEKPLPNYAKQELGSLDRNATPTKRGQDAVTFLKTLINKDAPKHTFLVGNTQYTIPLDGETIENLASKLESGEGKAAFARNVSTRIPRETNWGPAEDAVLTEHPDVVGPTKVGEPSKVGVLPKVPKTAPKNLSAKGMMSRERLGITPAKAPEAPVAAAEPVGAATPAKAKLEVPDVPVNASKAPSKREINNLVQAETAAWEKYHTLKAELGVKHPDVRAAGKAAGETRAALAQAMADAEAAGGGVPLSKPVKGVKAPKGAGPTSDTLKDLPPDEQEAALRDIIAKHKAGKFKGNKESGAIDPMLLARLGSSAAGAIAGATAFPNHPILGALLGASGGAYAPSLGRVIRDYIEKTPMSTNDQQLAYSKYSEFVNDKLQTFYKEFPDYFRSSLLARPAGLIANAGVGPYGSAIMGVMEDALRGDPRAFRALRELSPLNFGKEYGLSMREARDLIARSTERSEMSHAATTPIGRAIQLPADILTAGDVAARRILQRAGYSELEARRLTLTSDPLSATIKGVENMRKTKGPAGARSFVLNMLVPFFRTSGNQLEQSLLRTPIAPLMGLRKHWGLEPITAGHSLAQNALSGLVAFASYKMGQNSKLPDQRRDLKFISNFAGVYGTTAELAFLMGAASRRGESMGGQIGVAAKQLLTSELPLPQVGNVSKNILDFGAAAAGSDKGEMLAHLPHGVVPSIASSKDVYSIPTLFRDPKGFAIALHNDLLPDMMFNDWQGEARGTHREYSLAAPVMDWSGKHLKLETPKKEKPSYERELQKYHDRLREIRKQMKPSE